MARNIINELFPQYLRGKLDRETRHDDYIRLLKALNDIIRDTRCKRSKYLSKEQRPEDFLLHHFKPLLERKVSRLLKKFHLWKQVMIEQRDLTKVTGRNVRIEETETFLNWYDNASLIFRAMVLGPKDINTVKEKNSNRPDEFKYLEDISLRVNSHLTKLLGQTKKANKENFHLRFIAMTAESIDAANAISQKYKAYSPKQNPYFDEPAHYDPDYKKPEWRNCLIRYNMALTILTDWRKGEYPEVLTERECIDWVKLKFTDGATLEELNQEIRSYETEADRKPPNFILYVRGKGERQNGFVYERLRQLAYWHIKQIDPSNKNVDTRDVYLPDDQEEYILNEAGANDLISENILDENRVNHNSMWKEDENAAQIDMDPGRHISINNKSNK
jgi:hypothetical protein